MMQGSSCCISPGRKSTLYKPLFRGLDIISSTQQPGKETTETN